MIFSRSRKLPLRSIAAALLAASALSACAPLIIGAGVMGGMSVIDRRTSGAQLEDEAIELKVINRVHEAVSDRGHVNATSYNRMLLLTGEVASEADKAAVEQAVGRIENVRSVVDELGVMGVSSLSSRSNDTLITGKVKATFVDAKDIQANAFKVVTERSVVYLMGRVTEREAARASDLARRVSGVQKVVRVFDVISEAELADLQPPKKP